ncbi:hypothetical protein LT493_00800 [Streptomyces tricolor]|nr:hypothetical protein [Streptomyces tricolor]
MRPLVGWAAGAGVRAGRAPARWPGPALRGHGCSAGRLPLRPVRRLGGRRGENAPAVLDRRVRAGGGARRRAGAPAGRPVAGARCPPLVLGGDIDADGGSWGRPVQLAERLGGPGVGGALALFRLPFPSRHPQFPLCCPPVSSRSAEAFEGHDLVLVLPAPRCSRYREYLPGRYLPEGTRLVPGDTGRVRRRAGTDGRALVADPAAVIELLHEDARATGATATTGATAATGAVRRARGRLPAGARSARRGRGPRLHPRGGLRGPCRDGAARRYGVRGGVDLDQCRVVASDGPAPARLLLHFPAAGGLQVRAARRGRGRPWPSPAGRSWA